MKANLFGLIKLMRPKQWVKNIFVFAPLVFSALFTDAASIWDTFLAAAFFCIASSAIYIINDYSDIEQDRKHPIKSKSRPLASGQISKSQATALLIVLFLTLFLGYFIHPEVMLVIGGYLLLNLTYTFILKHQPVIDIFTIATGFVLRVYAGAISLSVPVSSWMFVTTLCLALFLAAVKRRQELMNNGKESRKVLEFYSIALLDKYAEMSATGALLFYSLFVMTTRPGLVMTIPLVIFGLYRYWFIVESKNEGESPTDVLYSDRQLLLTAIIWGTICVWTVSPMGV
ncbi:MAG: decaprenyl-phosphate phosphoribosyltransferase [Cellvibrionales bacterium]|nr:MAG: decaprenyl-phosphate phosphoribosyltransferase [Cellvibrionales bacterium]